MESVQPYPSANHQSLIKPSLPGKSAWLRAEEVAYIIVHLAASVLAYSIAPVAFCVGLGGAVISWLVVPQIRSLLSKSEAIVDSHIYPISGELLEAGFLGISLVGGVKLTPAAARIALLPTLICTLCGYYAPMALYHEVKALF